MVPLTVAAGGAALWALSHPQERKEPTPPVGGSGRLAALTAENSALRERLNATQEAHLDVQRQLSELRTQLQRLEAEASPIRRKCDRLKKQIEMERARHAESTQELSSEAARLRDYSNELIFTMIMNGVTPDAMSVPLPQGSSQHPSTAEASEDGRGLSDPDSLAQENQQLKGELARLRGALVRAVGASCEVTEENCRQYDDNSSRSANDGDHWPSPGGIGELAEQRRRCVRICTILTCSMFLANYLSGECFTSHCILLCFRAALTSIQPYVLASEPHHSSPAISPATTPIKGQN